MVIKLLMVFVENNIESRSVLCDIIGNTVRRSCLKFWLGSSSSRLCVPASLARCCLCLPACLPVNDCSTQHPPTATVSWFWIGLFLVGLVWDQCNSKSLWIFRLATTSNHLPLCSYLGSIAQSSQLFGSALKETRRRREVRGPGSHVHTLSPPALVDHHSRPCCRLCRIPHRHIWPRDSRRQPS